jgi:hypothetical protein
MKLHAQRFADFMLAMARTSLRSNARFLVGALLITIGTRSASQAQAAPGLDGMAILQRSSAAMGCSVLGKDTTVTVRGSLKPSDGGTVMQVSIQSRGNSEWRSELDTPKGRKVTIVSDGKGQMQHADGRVTPLAESNTSHQRPMHIPCLTDIALPTSAILTTVLRVETAAGDSLDVIELRPSSGPQSNKATDRMKTVVWISRTTGYLARLQYVNAAEDDSNDTQMVQIGYSDYRVVGGVAVPFHQVTRSGDFTLDLQLDSVQLNTPSADFSLKETK